ncbi:MAG: hypothetical protein ACYTGJ_13565 [Planctomycetota bacterium]|jgi:hypothetical protein
MRSDRSPVRALPAGALLTIVGLLLAGCGPAPDSGAVAVLPPQGLSFSERALALQRERGAEEAEAPGSSAGGATPAPRNLEEVGDPVRPRPETSTPEGGDARAISFQQLAGFEYETVDPLSMLQGGREPKTDIPPEIEALTGERVVVDGFLMPTIFDGGKVERFLLTRSYITCCFGDVLNMNEVIDVTVGPDLEVSYFLSGQPVTVTGWFEVGEKKSEFGYVESIYRLVAEEVVERW